MLLYFLSRLPDFFGSFSLEVCIAGKHKKVVGKSIYIHQDF